MTRLALLCAALLFCACPKNVAPHVSGTADERMDLFQSQLEEARSKASGGELQCADQCALKDTVCGLKDRVCDLAGSEAARDDFQKRCIAAQEDCARFNDACAGCR